MWKRSIILVTIFILILILLLNLSLFSFNNVRLYSKISYPIVGRINDNLVDLINIGFSASEYNQAKIQESKLENEYKVTAILLHWKRSSGVRKTAQYLLQTRLFQQIIIWNNNPDIYLTHYHLMNITDSSKFIRIINSNKNLKDEAKYRACAEATTKACFYIDDDWNASHYIKSLIASFRSDPNLLHSVTDAYTFYTNLVWSYFDHQIDLHTGFSWIGCGSIFSRQHAEKHLQLMQKFLKNNSTFMHLSDIFFSIWLNDIPVQMNTNLRYQPSPLPKGSVPFSSTPHFSQLQHISSVLAIRILENSLRFDQTKNDDNIIFSRQQNRRFPPYVKSPSFKDDLIFYSNVLPFSLENISFNISQDYQRGTRRNLPQDPNVKYFLIHSTSKVVDGDISTCWYTSQTIYPSAFFAVDFLHIQKNVIFTVSIAHSPIIQRNLGISISLNGIRWLPYQSLKGIFLKHNRTLEQHAHTFLFDSSQFSPGFQSFRYVSFQAMKHFDHRFQVCEIQSISAKNITIVRRDFHQLKT